MVDFENQYKTDQKESKNDSDGKTFNHQISQKRETRPPKRSVVIFLVQLWFTGSRPSVAGITNLVITNHSGWRLTKRLLKIISG